MGIGTLLFDLDGTLVDSRADLANAVNHALALTGQLRQADEDIVPHVGNGLRVLLSEVMGPVEDDLLEKAIAAFSDFYDAHCVDETRLYGGVAEALRWFHGKVKIGVVTNKPLKFAGRILAELGVAPLIGTVIGGDSLPERKPHPAPVIKAVTDLEGDIRHTLMVGDGVQDILAGQSAGARTCICRYGYGFRTDVLELKPDFAINAFTELKEIVL